MSDPIERLRALPVIFGPGRGSPRAIYLSDAEQVVTELQDELTIVRGKMQTIVERAEAAMARRDAELERLRGALAEIRAYSFQLGRDWRYGAVKNLGPRFGRIDTMIVAALAPVEKEETDG